MSPNRRSEELFCNPAPPPDGVVGELLVIAQPSTPIFRIALGDSIQWTGCTKVFNQATPGVTIDGRRGAFDVRSLADIFIEELRQRGRQKRLFLRGPRHDEA
jgi:hypothetical protein